MEEIAEAFHGYDDRNQNIVLHPITHRLLIDSLPAKLGRKSAYELLGVQ